MDVRPVYALGLLIAGLLVVIIIVLLNPQSVSDPIAPLCPSGSYWIPEHSTCAVPLETP